MPVPLLICAAWALLGLLAALLIVGGTTKPTPHPDPALDEDREVAELEALLALPSPEHHA